jgi:hypothetical protein
LLTAAEGLLLELEDFGAAALWIDVLVDLLFTLTEVDDACWALLFEEPGAAVVVVVGTVTILSGLASDEPMRSPHEKSNADVTAKDTRLLEQQHLFLAGTPAIVEMIFW